MDVNFIGNKPKVFGKERGRLIIVFIYLFIIYYYQFFNILEGARASTGLCVDVGSGVMI